MQTMNRKLVADEETVAPVTILDGAGRVVSIVPADEFRRIHPLAERSPMDKRRRKGTAAVANPLGREPDRLAEAS